MTRSLAILVLTGALAAGIGSAGGQGTGKSEMIKTDTQCWDTTLNIPRERMPLTTGTTGANTSGSGGSKSTTGAPSKSPNDQSSLTKRPSGMKDC